MEEKVVVIHKQGNSVVVQPNDVELSLGQMDTVRWVNTGGQDFEIDFGNEQNCPFDWPNGKAKGNGNSGLRSGSIRKTKYRGYDYTAAIEEAAADPQIIIRP